MSVDRHLETWSTDELKRAGARSLSAPAQTEDTMLTLLYYLTQAAQLLVIVDVVGRNMLPPNHPVRAFTTPLTEPVYAPIRDLISPYTGKLDLSPLVVLMVLAFIRLGVRTARKRTA